ncbi:MAG TPA: endo alpha-1,4 polygalactosaminidase [Candidatus Saccharimonadales bacterium]|nr:endo alpha-1,4 polygalactosaminidase [Candidatus Saccharimonadales bacterium]
MDKQTEVVVSEHSGQTSKGRFSRLFTRRSALISTFVLFFAAIGSTTVWWASAATTTYSLWSQKAVPKTITVSTDRSTELGMKFKARVAGQVTGIAFYKGPQNTGTHVGTLWDIRGNKLATVTFRNETKYGWQTATFTKPVDVAANVPYVISYSAPNGHYSRNTNYFKQSFTNNNLSGLRDDGPNGANGVYGRKGRFPRADGNGSNYWVDILFTSKRVAPKPAPAPPTGLTATQSGSSVIVSWIPASSENRIASYKLFRNGNQVATVGGSATTWTDKNVNAGQQYTYYAQSVDDTGTISANSVPVSITLSSVPTPTPTCPPGYTGTPPNCTPPPPPPSPTPTPTPTPSPSAIWKPTSAAPISWYWQLQGTISTSPLKASVYDIDGFDNTAATVKALQGNGARVICYLSLGTYEDFRPDKDQFPKAAIGASVDGWPGENWLDVTNPTVKTIMKARMQMCKDKGFDAIEPDNIDSYQNKPGFPTTAAQQAAYNQWIAETAHSLGLSIGLKNDLDQVPQLVSYFDWALNEECNQYDECETLEPFVKANKAVFNAEYKGGTTFCNADNAKRINGALFDLDLTGKYTPCKSMSSTTW